MPLISAVVGGVVALAGGLACYYEPDRVIRRETRRRPATAVRDVVDGARVKIVGRIALLPAAIDAPLTLRRCAGYRVELQSLDERTPRFIAEERAHDFLVRDDRGELVRVRASVARVLYEHDAELRTGRAQVSARLAELLERHPRSTRAAADDATQYLVREGVLALGDVVSIVGRAQREIDPMRGSYRDPSTRLVFDAAGDEPLYVVADPPRRRPTKTP